MHVPRQRQLIEHSVLVIEVHPEILTGSYDILSFHHAFMNDLPVGIEAVFPLIKLVPLPHHFIMEIENRIVDRLPLRIGLDDIGCVKPVHRPGGRCFHVCFRDLQMTIAALIRTDILHVSCRVHVHCVSVPNILRRTVLGVGTPKLNDDAKSNKEKTKNHCRWDGEAGKSSAFVLVGLGHCSF